MKKLLKGHSEAVLISLALVFIAIIVGYLYETIQAVVPEVDKAIARPTIAPAQGFDLSSVKKVDFKGLIDASGTVSDASPVLPPVAPATPPAHVTTTTPPAAAQPSSTAATSTASTVAVVTSTPSAPAPTSSDLTAPTGTAQ